MARKMKDSGIEWIGEIPEGWETCLYKYCCSVQPGYPFDSAKFSNSNTDGFPLIRIRDITSGEIQTYYTDSYDSSYIITAGDLLVGMDGDFNVRWWNNFDALLNQRCCRIIEKGRVSRRFIYYVLPFTLQYINTLTYATTVKHLANGDILNSFIAFPSLSIQKNITCYLDKNCSNIDSILSKTRASIEEYKKLKQAVITQAVTKGVRGEREMKDSGVEWIGEIPVEWEISRIKYVSIFEPSCDFRKLTPETIITYSPMECIKNGTFERRTSLYGNLAHTLTPFQDGDIVMAKVTPCFENGNIAIMNELQSGYGLGSSELFVFRPQNINTKYLFYWLQNKLFVHQACATMTGTGGLKRISPSFVKNCNIHYPAAAEQAEIADYLDAKCAEIDGLIAKKEQLVKELESYKKSLIYEVVTGKREV